MRAVHLFLGSLVIICAFYAKSVECLNHSSYGAKPAPNAVRQKLGWVLDALKNKLPVAPKSPLGDPAIEQHLTSMTSANAASLSPPTLFAIANRYYTLFSTPPGEKLSSALSTGTVTANNAGLTNVYSDVEERDAVIYAFKLILTVTAANKAQAAQDVAHMIDKSGKGNVGNLIGNYKNQSLDSKAIQAIL